MFIDYWTLGTMQSYQIYPVDMWTSILEKDLEYQRWIFMARVCRCYWYKKYKCQFHMTLVFISTYASPKIISLAQCPFYTNTNQMQWSDHWVLYITFYTVYTRSARDYFVRQICNHDHKDTHYICNCLTKQARDLSGGCITEIWPWRPGKQAIFSALIAAWPPGIWRCRCLAVGVNIVSVYVHCFCTHCPFVHLHYISSFFNICIGFSMKLILQYVYTIKKT